MKKQYSEPQLELCDLSVEPLLISYSQGTQQTLPIDGEDNIIVNAPMRSRIGELEDE